MADYPELIHLDEKTKNELIIYLNTELTNHYMERSGFINDLEEMQHSYWAEPEEGELTFPFTGASKIVVPLNAIAVEAIHARTMQTIFGMDQIITAKATNPEWYDAVKAIETFFDRELVKNVKIRSATNDAFLECEKFGTGILKSGYTKIVKKAVRQVDGRREEFEVITKQGATLDAVPLSRFIMPYAELDEQNAAWCGEEHSLTPHQIQLHEYAGMFYKGTYEKLRYLLTTTGAYGERQLENSQEKLEKRELMMPSRINFQEIWLAWNVDRNDDYKLSEICVYYQRESQTIMGIRYNWYDDLHRPYRKGVYFPIEHRWTGIGVIKQNNQFQEEITTKHRQFLDNATMANMRMLKVSKLSGIQPGEPIFPGKLWFLDDMSHLESVQMGEVYPSAYNTEQATMMLAQQRNGVNELTTGQPQAGTPGTASDTLVRVQEGNKKFGYSFANMKEFASQAYLDVICNIVQFGPKTVEFLDYIENGDRVKQFLQLPVEYVREGFVLDLKAAGQLENKLIDRQNFSQVAQIIQQYYTGMLQIATQSGDPNLISSITQTALTGSTEIVKQLLESFDIRDIERIILNANGLISGTGSGAIGAGTQPGMESALTGGSPLPNFGL